MKYVGMLRHEEAVGGGSGARGTGRSARVASVMILIWI